VTGVGKVPSGVLSVMPAVAKTSACRPRATNTVGIAARASNTPTVPPIAPAPTITYRWSSRGVNCDTFHRFSAMPLITEVTRHSRCGVDTEHRLAVVVGQAGSAGDSQLL
jgi:hypothetical protein